MVADASEMLSKVLAILCAAHTTGEGERHSYCEATGSLAVRCDLTAAHMAISMLRSSTDVSVTNRNEIAHAASGAFVESRAHSKKSFPVNARPR